MKQKKSKSPYLDKYVGEWVVLYKNKIIGHNKDLRLLNNKIDGCKEMPLIIKVPKYDFHILPCLLN